MRGVAKVSRSATKTARVILVLESGHRRLINEHVTNTALGHRLLELLLRQPIVSVRFIEKNLDCAFVTANKLAEQFVKLGLRMEKTGAQRYRQFEYDPYLRIFYSLPEV